MRSYTRGSTEYVQAPPTRRHLEVLAIRGQRNILPHPIYLPPLLMSEAKIVGGNEDVSLRIPGFEGFEMIVKANSVTFPDGTKVGPLVISPVHADRLPMVPPGGSAIFMAPAWTIQPTGTRFDPPIEVRIPNSGGLKPGETSEIYQWDHDLGMFVPMGRATVSEDGALLITDPSSGVTKAGWGGPPPPPQCKANASNKECSSCERFDQMSGGGGNCPPQKLCVFDNAKEGLRDTNFDVGTSRFGWEPKFWQIYKGSIVDRLARWGGAELNLQGQISGTVRTTRLCCAAAKPSARTVYVSLGGDVELEGKWDWFKGSKLAKYFTGADELGIYTKLKFYFGTAGSTVDLSWDDCRRKASGKVFVGGGATFTVLEPKIKGKAVVNGQEIDVEFTMFSLSAGATSSAELVSINPTAYSAFGKWSWYANAKIGEWKFGDFKFTLVDVAASDKGAINELAPLF